MCSFDEKKTGENKSYASAPLSSKATLFQCK
jgi:hypothetical protein